MRIKYFFKFENGTQETFELDIHTETMQLKLDASMPPPDWTGLCVARCPDCPLDADMHAECPAALALVDFARRLGRIVSFEETELVVVTEERWVGQKTTAQRGMSSLMGLLLATSGCPVTAYMRPMARFHLPLSTDVETTYRAVGMYLTARYIAGAAAAGEETPGLRGLVDIYDRLQNVNAWIARRLRESGEIAELNALVLLDSFAQTIPYAIEDDLPEIRALFDSYVERPDVRGASPPLPAVAH